MFVSLQEPSNIQKYIFQRKEFCVPEEDIFVMPFILITYSFQLGILGITVWYAAVENIESTLIFETSYKVIKIINNQTFCSLTSVPLL